MLTRERRTAEGGLVSAQTDISEVKATQAALAGSEQHLREALETVSDAAEAIRTMWVRGAPLIGATAAYGVCLALRADPSDAFVYFDGEGRLGLHNDIYRELLGYTREEVQPGVTRQLLGDIDATRGLIGGPAESSDFRVRRRAQLTEGLTEMTFPMADGRWILSRARRMDHGGVVSVLTDITELKNSQMSAEAANQAKTQFLAHMSQELRTPLNSIIGFSEVLREQVMGSLSDTYRDYAQTIHQSGVHLLALINDILDMAKVEAGEIQPVEEDVHLADVAADCLTMMRPRAVDKGLRLECELPAELPP
ncbi:MAG: histidine kinase dimerization/phospho-acceptor domain-containing protein, partial [Rhodospirillaceae bacterium]